jgi:hypothetical protein
MLELDNLAFDFGLTVFTKQEINKAWEVYLEGFQIRLLNLLRRWHVAMITLAIPIYLLVSVRTLKSSTDRQIGAYLVFMFIIAAGELVELVLLFKSRSSLQNKQRIFCYLLKVGPYALCSEDEMGTRTHPPTGRVLR